MSNELEQLQSAMKQAMRRLAGSVCVVSTRSGDTRNAMSATAVTSLSMDPPSLLVCVNKAAPFHEAIADGGDFYVNVLKADQTELSAACGGKLQGEEKFTVGAWGANEDGVPFLEDALASLLCKSDGRFEYGTHTIFVGRVEDIRVAETIEPLLYVDGSYATTIPLQAAE